MSFANPSRFRTGLRWFLMIALFCLAAVFFWGAYVLESANNREVAVNTEAAPTTGTFQPAGDVRLFVQSVGNESDPAVVFIHGTGSWSETWRPVMNAVAAKGYRAVALDIPPFGYSDRPASEDYSRQAQGHRILSVLAALNLKNPILVGHSFGARATLTALLEKPDAAKAVVFVDPAPGFAAEPGQPAATGAMPGASILGVRLVREMLIAATVGNPNFTRKLLSGFVYEPEKIPEATVAIYQRPMNQKGNTPAVANWLYQFIGKDDPTLMSDVETFAARSKLPIELIWGDKDTVTPLWQGERLRELWNGSQLQVLDGVGHIPQIESEARFIEMLLSSLSRVGQPTRLN